MAEDSNPSSKAEERLIRAYYETTSGVTLSTHASSRNLQKLTRGLKRGLGDWIDVEDKRVVDLGCGTGELCWLACEARARSVVGVNLSEGELNLARGSVNADFVCADVLDYLRGLPDRSVDRIYALNLLEHLSKDVLVQVLEEANRCLADGGALTAIVPNAVSTFGSMTRYWDITHQLAFTPSSVNQLMRLCGYDGSAFREWAPQPHGIASSLRYLLWQGVRGVTAVRLLIETGSVKGGVYTADMIFRLSR